MNIFNICALDKQALLPATALATEPSPSAALLPTALATELSPSTALSTTNLKANPYTTIMDTFMFDPNNTKSLYWRTLFIVIRHFFVYYVLLIIFSALTFLFIGYLCKFNYNTDSEYGQKILILFIIVSVFMLSFKIFIDKFGGWFNILLLFCQFFLIAVIMTVGLIGAPVNNEWVNPNPSLSIFFIFILFICMLIFNLIFASFDWYKRLWDVDTNDTSKAIAS